MRDSDRAAWRSVPILELEKHPLFSSLPHERRELSDGSELWDFANCSAVKANTNCTTNDNGLGGVNTRCSGGQQNEVCCHNQFIVRAGLVEEYRPVGQCQTDCSTRPGGACR